MNLYDPLLERDVDGIRAATREYRRDHTSHELFQAVARFALLAYSPSQHGKHAVISCLSAHELRGEAGERYDDLLTECAIYAASARQPWSEPPITDPPALDGDEPDEPRLRAERCDHHWVCLGDAPPRPGLPTKQHVLVDIARRC